MPCNSDYMEADEREINESRVLCLLDELAGKKWKPEWWRGYHPKAYCKPSSLDARVAALCKALQNVDVKKYSLEMQIWWRDHQAADKARLEEEQKKVKDKRLLDKALRKLSTYERKLLGIKE